MTVLIFTSGWAFSPIFLSKSHNFVTTILPPQVKLFDYDSTTFTVYLTTEITDSRL